MAQSGFLLPGPEMKFGLHCLCRADELRNNHCFPQSCRHTTDRMCEVQCAARLPLIDSHILCRKPHSDYNFPRFPQEEAEPDFHSPTPLPRFLQNQSKNPERKVAGQAVKIPKKKVQSGRIFYDKTLSLRFNLRLPKERYSDIT